MIFAFGWEKRTCVRKKIERNEENKHTVGTQKRNSSTAQADIEKEREQKKLVEEARTNQEKHLPSVTLLLCGGTGF